MVSLGMGAALVISSLVSIPIVSQWGLFHSSKVNSIVVDFDYILQCLMLLDRNHAEEGFIQDLQAQYKGEFCFLCDLK